MPKSMTLISRRSVCVTKSTNGSTRDFKSRLFPPLKFSRVQQSWLLYRGTTNTPHTSSKLWVSISSPEPQSSSRTPCEVTWGHCLWSLPPKAPISGFPHREENSRPLWVEGSHCTVSFLTTSVNRDSPCHQLRCDNSMLCKTLDRYLGQRRTPGGKYEKTESIGMHDLQFKQCTSLGT